MIKSSIFFLIPGWIADMLFFAYIILLEQVECTYVAEYIRLITSYMAL